MSHAGTTAALMAAVQCCSLLLGLGCSQAAAGVGDDLEHPRPERLRSVEVSVDRRGLCLVERLSLSPFLHACDAGGLSRDRVTRRIAQTGHRVHGSMCGP